MANDRRGNKLCYAYVIASVQNGLYVSPTKVGITDNPSSRLSTIRTSCPFNIEMVYWVPMPNREAARWLEEEWHETNAGSRLNGEWFDVDPNAAIAAMTVICAQIVEALVADKDERGRILDDMRLLETLKKCISIERAREAALAKIPAANGNEAVGGGV